jgi:outer membrane protein assembly factor BamD (BamD/ComL family)
LRAAAAALFLALAGCAQVDPHTLYERGRIHYRQGNYRAAIQEFESAYRASHAPALLFDLAQAHRRDGDRGRALPLYRAYLRDLPHAKNRAEVQRRIADLEAGVRSLK